MIAYKLVRVLKDGGLAPLFINKKSRFVIGEEYIAEDVPTKGFAHRFGIHCCFTKHAPHLSTNLKSGEKRAWIKVEIIGDYQVYDRPESQGGEWVLAKDRVRVLELVGRTIELIK